MPDTNHKKVTLRTISQKLGVSQATVSKALRESTDISEEMKRKVRAISDELGYHPNLLARGLVQRRSNIIGVIIPDLNISYYADLVQHIYESAQKMGYESIVMFHHEDAVKERENLQFLVSLQVDGILISETNGHKNADMINKIQNQGTPVVYYDRINQKAQLGFVTIDDTKATEALIKAFIDRDRIKIGYIGATNGEDVTVVRFKSYRKLLPKFGLKYDPALVIDCMPDGCNTMQKMKTALHKGIDIDALLCAGGLIAYNAGKAILSEGIRMPEDVILGEFGNNNIVQRLGISYFSIDQSPNLIAKNSIELLQSSIAHQEVPWEHRDIFVESKLIYYDHYHHKEQILKLIK